MSRLSLDYPVALRLAGKRVLVVGAGRIAEGRVRQLLEVEANVHLVSPEATPALRALAEEGALRLSERAYRPGDCEGAFLVFTASNDAEVNRAVVGEARGLGILANAADVPDLCDFYVPSIGRRGPVVVAVSTAGQAPSLARALRERAMEAIGPEYGQLARLIGRLRHLVAPSPGRTRLFEHLVRSPAVLEQLRTGNRLTLWSYVRQLLEQTEDGAENPGPGVSHACPGPRAPVQAELPVPGTSKGEAKGIVYLVGAGPGDPSLLTLRAAELLSKADTVLYDRLVHPDVLRHVRPGARLIFAGKEGGGAHVSQDDINRALIAQARLGRSVVRLKGGDPFVFGRGGEEALALAAARIPFQVVPGVSSGVAAPAAAGIPVTHRGLSTAVTFATAYSIGEEPDWAHLARSPTLVLFMGGKRLARICEALARAGRSPRTPAALVEAGTWEGQRVIEGTLADIAQRGAKADVGSPALLVIGEVAALRSQLVDFLVPPLAGAGGTALVPPSAGEATGSEPEPDALPLAGSARSRPTAASSTRRKRRVTS